MRQRTWTVAYALGLCGLIWLCKAYWAFTVDDTYIFLRYAENVSIGLGPTWNADGPRIEGYTSPLWLLLLSLTHGVAAAPATPAKVLGVGLMIGATFAAAELAASLLRDASPLARAIVRACVIVQLALLPAMAIHAVSGMETALTTCALTSFAWLMGRAWEEPSGRRFGALAATGLLLATSRPEMNLVVFGSLALLTWQVPRVRRAELVRSAVGFYVLPGATYFIWRLAYYETLLPLPFYVKTMSHGRVLPGAEEVWQFLRSYAYLRPHLLLGVLGFVMLRRRAALPLVPLLAIGVFFVFPEHQMGFNHRYLHPLLPAWVALSCAGLVQLAERLAQYRNVPVQVWHTVACLTLGVVSGVRLAQELPPSLEEKRGYGRGIERAHAPLGQALGTFRGQLERPVLATLDSGALAYHSKWHVVDTWGLNNPDAVHGKARSVESVFSAQPTVLVVVSARADRFEPHFEYERALWGAAHERGFEHLVSYEFLPDYHLFLLAAPGGAVAKGLSALPVGHSKVRDLHHQPPL